MTAIPPEIRGGYCPVSFLPKYQLRSGILNLLYLGNAQTKNNSTEKDYSSYMK